MSGGTGADKEADEERQEDISSGAEVGARLAEKGGKVMCGSCGSSFTSAGRAYLACRTVVTGGSCGNRRHVRRDRLEAQVLAALRDAVMQPEAIAAFVEEFSREWNRGLAERGAAAEGRRRELEAVRRKLSGLIDAMADGYRAPDLQERLDELSTRRASLEAELSAAKGSELPRLHGNLAQVYRERLDRLSEALSAEGGTEVREALRALVERVVVSTDRVELVGALTSLLRAGGAEELGANANGPSAGLAEGLVRLCSVKGDAGTRELIDLLLTG
jgi:site-specific DNA recombinase